ncbi:MAG: hypothetical protein HOQ02_01165 [Lysobacter sp.]|nr:hypothetical protein [Lysobacter sp.]
MATRSNQAQLWLASLEVFLWAIAQREQITWQAIRERWDVDRSTAFRWRDVLEAARVRAQNMPIPRQPSYRRPVAAPEARAS